MDKNKDLRKLPLSHLVYLNSEVDADKANKFVVYHYPLLNNSYQWKEKKAWEERIDAELDSRQFAYLMKKNGNQFGLYVALQSSSDIPPSIVDAELQPITPVRVEYSPVLNPVWIRLMMRSLRAFGGHCKGAYSLGCPLLKVDSWAGGVNAISLDCRTQQLNDGNTTEIALFYTNVPLRPLSNDDDIDRIKKPLWVYDKNKVLVRWYPGHERKPRGTLFKEIGKSKNSRKQRPFLDLSTPTRFEQSWPMVLKPVQDAFILFARDYGFELSAKTLNLQPLSLKTKHKANKAKSSFPSIEISGEIKVIDLRVNAVVAGEEILDLLKSLIAQKDVDVSWDLLDGIAANDFERIKLERSDRVLILLDQEKGIEDDRYPLTKSLIGRCAVQHINVNPHDVTGDPVEKRLLIESKRDDDPIKLYVASEGGYYTYNYELLDTKAYKEAIIRKLEVVLKELEIKRLLIDSDRAISQVLPLQRACLNESTIVITDGYLFTVSNDRPVLIPFDPTDSGMTLKINEYLANFETSVDDLLTLMNEKWPYSYRQNVVMDYYGTEVDKQRRFAARITLVLSKDKDAQVSIMMQDPSYDKTNVLPLGMEDALSDLTKKQKPYPLTDWVLPDSEVLLNIVKELSDDGVLSSQKATMRFESELPELVELWQEQLVSLHQQNETKVTYYQVKKEVIQRWLDKRGKKKDTSISGSLDTLLSRYFDKPLNDIKRWMSNIPGIQRIWYDKEKGYFVVGGLTSPKAQLMRQPSIRQWHTLQGELDIELLADLLDVDWVRMNQLAGNPCVTTLIKRWKEINPESRDAILLSC
jgi:hypothetical protein